MKRNIILTVLFLSAKFAGATAPNADADFKSLLKLFPKGTFPYAITMESLKKDLLIRNGVETDKKSTQTQRRTRIGRQYYALLPDMAPFSRAPVMPEAIAALESPNNYALVYTFGHYDIDYRIAVYSKNGEFLFKKPIAFAETDKIQEVVLDENLKATFTTHNIAWAKDVEKHGFEKNKIKEIKIQKKELVDLAQLAKESLPNKDKKKNKPKSTPSVGKEPEVIRA
jgi:hypothetical protein